MNIKPFSSIASYLENRKEKKALKKKHLEKLWQNQLEKNVTNYYEHGFNKIKFPILLIEGSFNEETNNFEYYNYELTLVEDLNEFTGTTWYLAPNMQYEFNLIDFKGEIWDFKYSEEIDVCIPGSLLKKLELNELKSFVTECINWRDQDEVKDAIQKANSIPSVFEVIGGKYYKSFL